jgi:hypothetical protein
MKKLAGIFLCVCLALVGAEAVAAQASGDHAPPKVLSITREWVKPGRTGAIHEKTESLFVQTFARAKWPTHYIGMESLSGKSRALFFTGYDSFEAWEKDNAAEAQNAAFSAAFAHAALVDGELLDAFDQSLWSYDEDDSNSGGVNIATMRYFEIERFQIRPGHEEEWIQIMKLVKPALMKGMPDDHWAMYVAAYGIPQPTYIVLTPMKSATEIDRTFAQGAKFVAAMGADGMKKLSELSAVAIESSETNLFSFNPRMSYVGEDWAKADPFWKTMPAKPAAAKKSEEKPSAKP